MATITSEKVWLNRGNIAQYVVMDGDTPVTDLSSFTRAVFCIGSYIIDSDVEGTDIIWMDTTVTDRVVTDDIIFTGQIVSARLGLTAITSGTYTGCSLTLFSPDYVDGVVVEDNLTFVVLPDCIGV